jgi:polysaccharide pyruvyl transferase WcaK-like protein
MHDKRIEVIGLLDHMGYGNLGDAAVQESVIANIRKRLPHVQLVGFSLNPEDTVSRHGIPCHPILRWHPALKKSEQQAMSRSALSSRLKAGSKRIPVLYPCAKGVLEALREIRFCVRSYRTLSKLDLLIISGGGQLSELWRGPWSHPYTIFKFSCLTKLARGNVYFLNVGAGPLRHPLSRYFARQSVQWAEYRSFRDDVSRDLVRSLGVGSKMHVYPDPAYGLEVDGHLTAARDGASQIVGLNPIGFCDPRIWPRKDALLYQEYLEKLTRFSTWLLEHGYDLRVFTTETSVDHEAIKDLKARLLLRFTPDVVFSVFRPASSGLKDVLEEMSEFDFVVTSKFHGVIFSQLLGKPVVALSYHNKMNVAMREVGQEKFCADIESFDVEWVIDAFRSLVAERSNIRSKFTNAVAAYRRALAEQFDGLFGMTPDAVRTTGLAAGRRMTQRA